LASLVLLQSMAVFHLQCVIHRGCVSGIALDIERITAGTDAEAISEAKARFARLLGPRSGLAILKDDAGRPVWTSRLPNEANLAEKASKPNRQAPQASNISVASGRN
jgi:hypothetical protein